MSIKNIQISHIIPIMILNKCACYIKILSLQ